MCTHRKDPFGKKENSFDIFQLDEKYIPGGGGDEEKKDNGKGDAREEGGGVASTGPLDKSSINTPTRHPLRAPN